MNSPSTVTLAIEGILLAACSGVAAIGYGSGLARIFRIYPNIGDRGILGFAVIGLLACLLHFMVALSPLVEACILFSGITFSVVFRRVLSRECSTAGTGLAILTILLLLRLKAQPMYDYSLYYLQTFEWNRQFPVVAGLGNLHGRLAYNSLLFLLLPLMDSGKIGWITNFLVLAFVTQSLFDRLRRIDCNDRHNGVQFYFISLLLFAFIFRPGLLDWSGVMRADAFAAALIFYWVAVALGLSNSGAKRTDFILMLISAALAAAIKISAAPLVAITGAIWCFHYREKLITGRALTFVCLFFIAWLLHGFMLSGCAIYPIQALCFPGLGWSVSSQQIADEMIAIKASARLPFDIHYSQVLQNWGWMQRWSANAIHDRPIPAIHSQFRAGRF